jgi:dTDP-4-dehydrorhamnose reductase
MRIAVTGAGGGVGRAFLERGTHGHVVTPFGHKELPVEDAARAAQLLKGAHPDVILHLAGMTSVDGCEKDPERARVVNAEGTRNVARAAREARAMLVAMSTDYVFDGKQEEPYDERDEPNPINVYGRSKREAELAVEDTSGEYVIVRTSWVFGAPGEFVRRSVEELASGETVGGIVDQIGTPTFVGHLADRLVPLFESGIRGIVHLAGPEQATWYDVLARAKQLGRLSGDVVEQEADGLGRPAPRPAYSALASTVLPATDLSPMPPLDDGLREVLAHVR